MEAKLATQALAVEVANACAGVDIDASERGRVPVTPMVEIAASVERDGRDDVDGADVARRDVSCCDE